MVDALDSKSSSGNRVSVRVRPPAPPRKMHKKESHFTCRCLGGFLAGLVLCANATSIFAWSADGHNAIGMLALDQLKVDTRERLESVVGELNEETVSEACNWPDVIREEQEWEWAKPLHYVNIPRGESDYQASRDCRNGRCATVAIKKFATWLAEPQRGEEARWQGFAWLCHLVADLHQPLHAGFGDDRGGNEVEITVRGEVMNLHYYWDRELASHQVGDWQRLYQHLHTEPLEPIAGSWSSNEVDAWTEESHQLAASMAYPPANVVTADWEQQAWIIARERMRLAAMRLAWVLETILE